MPLSRLHVESACVCKGGGQSARANRREVVDRASSHLVRLPRADSAGREETRRLLALRINVLAKGL